MTKYYENKFINRILFLINNSNSEEEKVFTFEQIHNELKTYCKTLFHDGYFDNIFNDKKLIIKAKNYFKKKPDKLLMASMRIPINITIDNINYSIDTKISADSKHYFKGILRKRNFNTYLNECLLIYIKMNKNNDVIYEMGKETLGTEVERFKHV